MVKQSVDDVVTVVAAGVTLHEALRAFETLNQEGIKVRVIDLYSVKPLDVETLKKAAEETKAIITVEDHFAEGGIGEAIVGAIHELPLRKYPPIHTLAVRKMPRSGKPEDLLAYEEIDAGAIVKKVKEVIENF